MIARSLTEKLLHMHRNFPVVALTGARQTGKTTLLKSIFTELPHVNLEDPDNRILAETDPRGFLSNYPDGVVIDEAQRVPLLFSYLQQIVDNSDAKFILSGSQNFLLLERITQSLAGRVAVLSLMPLSYEELKKHGYPFGTLEEIMFTGFYPRIYDRAIAPADFYPHYISTYVERDVRQIKNIENLSLFIVFLKLCAGRAGQILNMQSLANEVGVSVNTIKSWLSVLEASYIVYLLQPHHRNFNKRLTKSPKIYFYDTGLLCSLLDIERPEQISSHFLRGGIFENFVINEVMKHYWNKGQKPPICFWQSKDKKEIDLIIEKGEQLYPIEIKAAKTKNLSLMSNLKYWDKQCPTPAEFLNLIYAGDEDFSTSQGNFICWKNIHELAEKLDQSKTNL